MDHEQRILALEEKVAALEVEAQRRPAFDKKRFLETAKSSENFKWQAGSNLETIFNMLAECLNKELTEFEQ